MNGNSNVNSLASQIVWWPAAGSRGGGGGETALPSGVMVQL